VDHLLASGRISPQIDGERLVVGCGKCDQRQREARRASNDASTTGAKELPATAQIPLSEEDFEPDRGRCSEKATDARHSDLG